MHDLVGRIMGKQPFKGLVVMLQPGVDLIWLHYVWYIVIQFQTILQTKKSIVSYCHCTQPKCACCPQNYCNRVQNCHIDRFCHNVSHCVLFYRHCVMNNEIREQSFTMIEITWGFFLGRLSGNFYVTMITTVSLTTLINHCNTLLEWFKSR